MQSIDRKEKHQKKSTKRKALPEHGVYSQSLLSAHKFTLVAAEVVGGRLLVSVDGHAAAGFWQGANKMRPSRCKEDRAHG
jgi:hypothetical protein